MKMNSVRKIALLVLALPLLAIGYTLIRPASADTIRDSKPGLTASRWIEKALEQCAEKRKKCWEDCSKSGRDVAASPCSNQCQKGYQDCVHDIPNHSPLYDFGAAPKAVGRAPFP